ncbi:MAG: UDP-N-acetylmuramate dehydrogenase [Bacteroidota bacterium]
MTKHYRHYSIKELNSFGIDVRARNYLSFNSFKDLQEYVQKGIPEDHLIIGEGSNLLFRTDYNGTLIHPAIKGINPIAEDELFIDIEVSSGENWDSFVDYCCQHNYAGLENLSLIPGAVGSAPVQNIGAYGVEVKDRILWVKGIDIDTGEWKKIFNKECKFGYRSSIFKQQLQGKFIITSVLFRLDKKPSFILDYGNIEVLFRHKGKQNLETVRECIIEIRRSKLPDHKETGNAGSFFKNPVLSVEHFSLLKTAYPDIPNFTVEGKIKIPAAWLIEKAGWKGVREGQTGTWPKQPLVIVNYGNATGEEIFTFSEKIRKAVRDRFSIELDREVKVI